MVEKIEVLVDGGKATPGPPLGPALGPLGVNVVEIVAAINEKTKAFVGMKVPVKLTIDEKTKAFEISVGTPPTSALVLKELGLASGSGNAPSVKVGSLKMDQIKRVGEMKKDSLLGNTLKERVLEVAGTCVSMGVEVEGLDPKAFQDQMRRGKFDKHFE
ncbi:MAG: 50S ribosomal protein L11 [Thermoplasmata archaeon]|nr:50S ribosomal protein L11 [Thermoplasmata archaeon]